jgi:Zn-dependent protease with chaperone function
MDDAAIEGVIAHEVAHIANGDLVTMILLQGVVTNRMKEMKSKRRFLP